MVISEKNISLEIISVHQTIKGDRSWDELESEVSE